MKYEFVYEYEITRTHDPSNCSYSCKITTVKDTFTKLPDDFNEYFLLRSDEGTGMIDSSPTYTREHSIQTYLARKDGQLFVITIETEYLFSVTSNAIECKSEAGTRLMPACETGRGTYTVTVEIKKLEDFLNEITAEYKNIDEAIDDLWDYEEDGISLTGVIKEEYNLFLEFVESMQRSIHRSIGAWS